MSAPAVGDRNEQYGYTVTEVIEPLDDDDPPRFVTAIVAYDDGSEGYRKWRA